jgi:hypothetical protein
MSARLPPGYARTQLRESVSPSGHHYRASILTKNQRGAKDDENVRGALETIGENAGQINQDLVRLEGQRAD